MSSLPLIAGIVLAASTLQGFSGFGFGLIFMGLASHLIGAKHASLVGVLLALANTSIVLWNVRHAFELGKVKPFLMGAVFGLPVGVWGLAKLSSHVLAIGLGILLIAFCSYSLLNPPRSQKPWQRFWGYPLGVVSGLLAGALNVGGPPIVIYTYYQPWDKESIKASLVTYFAILAAYKTALLFATRLMTGRILLEALVSVPLLSLGANLGMRLSDRYNKDQVRQVAFMVLIVLGLLLLVRQ